MVVAGIVLIALARSTAARVGASIYVSCSAVLFGISAMYHRGHWGQPVRSVLKRLDHANIYLLIAGTYTPFALLCLSGPAQVAVLIVVWTGAVAGAAFRAGWVAAPRWLYTSLYILIGWTAAFVVPQLLRGAGVTAFTLVVLGGALYTAGGVVYALEEAQPVSKVFRVPRGLPQPDHCCIHRSICRRVDSDLQGGSAMSAPSTGNEAVQRGSGGHYLGLLMVARSELSRTFSARKVGQWLISR